MRLPQNQADFVWQHDVAIRKHFEPEHRFIRFFHHNPNFRDPFRFRAGPAWPLGSSRQPLFHTEAIASLTPERPICTEAIGTTLQLALQTL